MKTFKQYIKEQEDRESWDRQVDSDLRSRTVNQIGNKFAKRPMNNIPDSDNDQQYTKDVLGDKPTSEVSAGAYNRMFSRQREHQNVTNRINNDFKSSNEPGTDARTGQAYVKPRPERVPLTGRVNQADLNAQAVRDGRTRVQPVRNNTTPVPIR